MALFLLPAVRWSRNECGPGGLLIAGSRVPAAVSARRPGLLSRVLLCQRDGVCQGAVAAAQRKHDSSRATATTVTLCGLPRARIEV